jgi:hypothetical protein
MSQEGECPEVTSEEPNMVSEDTIGWNKLETVIIRVARACLVCSALLFVSLFVVCCVTWVDPLSVLICVILSILLFAIWLSIHGVYEGGNVGKLPPGIKVKKWR